jgi:hypothetical protein
MTVFVCAETPQPLILTMKSAALLRRQICYSSLRMTAPCFESGETFDAIPSGRMVSLVWGLLEADELQGLLENYSGWVHGLSVVRSCVCRFANRKRAWFECGDFPDTPIDSD